MKKLSMILVLALVLASGAVTVMSAPAAAQVYGGYTYPAPPPNPYATPWVGPNTPWTYYNGDWFLNGILYYFFGQKYGWAPYYAYAPTYIVRPNYWYGPMWHAWYQGNPHYWENFRRAYPYWRDHQYGHRYDRDFYERHHHGQGGGWQRGWHGGPPHEGPYREGEHGRRYD